MTGGGHVPQPSLDPPTVQVKVHKCHRESSISIERCLLETCVRQMSEAEQSIANSRARLNELLRVGETTVCEATSPENDCTYLGLPVLRGCAFQVTPVASTSGTPRLNGVSPVPSSSDSFRPPSAGQFSSQCYNTDAVDQVTLDLLNDTVIASDDSHPIIASDTSREMIRFGKTMRDSVNSFGTPSSLRWTSHSEGPAKPGSLIYVRGQLPVIHPESRIRMSWLLVGLLLIHIEAIQIPYFLSFGIPQTWVYFVSSSFINTYFLLDIVLTFFTAEIGRDSVMITQYRHIALNYIRKWFILDFIASVPWEWLDNLMQAHTDALQSTRTFRMARIGRIMRLVRLARLAKLKNMVERFEEFTEAHPIIVFAMDLIRLMALVFLLTHWAACAWYALGARDDPVGPTWFSHLPDGTTVEMMYIWSIYFATTTMTTVGYGDITPTNIDECGFALFLLAVACVVFAALMGVLTDMICSFNQSSRAIAEKKVVLVNYLHWRVVPPKLASHIRQHLIFIWDVNKDFDSYEDELKRLLPVSLQSELNEHIYGKILESMPFLAWMRDYRACVQMLTNNVKSSIFEVNDEIVRVGQPNTQIFILLTGTVFLTANDDCLKKPTVSKAVKLVGFLLPRARSKGHIAAGNQRDTTRQCRQGFNALEDAADCMLNKDLEDEMAVMKIQRSWRRKCREGFARLKHKPRTMECLQSKHLKAPAHFGESCLWTPLELWDSVPPPKYAYTVKCETRGEFCRFDRTAIKKVIERFSPAMASRFESFRQIVLSKTSRAMDHTCVASSRPLDRSCVASSRSPSFHRSVYGQRLRRKTIDGIRNAPMSASDTTVSPAFSLPGSVTSDTAVEDLKGDTTSARWRLPGSTGDTLTP